MTALLVFSPASTAGSNLLLPAFPQLSSSAASRPSCVWRRKLSLRQESCGGHSCAPNLMPAINQSAIWVSAQRKAAQHPVGSLAGLEHPLSLIYWRFCTIFSAISLSYFLNSCHFCVLCNISIHWNPMLVTKHSSINATFMQNMCNGH